jgi:hypothetical protein
VPQQIVPFLFEDAHLLRSVILDAEPWFVGIDACKVLDIAKHEQALGRLDRDERGTCPVGTPGGTQNMIVISEAGFYRLIFRSSKPVAERLKRWLAHEVLPSIRKTGSYHFGPEAIGAGGERLTAKGLNAFARAGTLLLRTLGPRAAIQPISDMARQLGMRVNERDAEAIRQGEFDLSSAPDARS